jgi:hypothetical protein
VNNPREFRQNTSSEVGAAFAVMICIAVVAIWLLS